MSRTGPIPPAAEIETMMTQLKYRKIRSAQRTATQDREGAMLPILAVVIIILFIAVSLGVDIARMHVTRSELRTATDAAARAGVEALGRLQNRQAAIDAAIAAANANVVAGKNLTITAGDIQLGTSFENNDGTFGFDTDGNIVNAVSVLGRRTADSPDGTVNLLFGPIFGVTDFEPVASSIATRSDRDIALVLDVSGSMSVDGRFQALTDALSEFLQILDATPQQERISLTVYSTADRKLQDMTDNFALIRNVFANESPGGFTAIGQGLNTGLNSVLSDPGIRPFAQKSIIVMTDGNHNRGVSPDIIAQLCADEGITVHTITFSAGANQQLMRRVADIAGGRHIQADSNQDLIDAFEEIARQLSVLTIE